jgi:hypothetical protein
MQRIQQAELRGQSTKSIRYQILQLATGTSLSQDVTEVLSTMPVDIKELVSSYYTPQVLNDLAHH